MRTLKLLSLLLGLYVAVGVIAFPWWWYQVLTTLDLQSFFQEALGPYFFHNLALAAVVCGLGYAHRTLGTKTAKPVWIERLDTIIDSRAASATVWTLLILSIARALFVGFDTRAEQRPGRVADPSTTSVRLSPVQLPIELVFADRARLSDLFGQLLGELKIAEQKLLQKDSIAVEGSANAGVATAGTKSGRESERSTTLTAVEPNDPVKTVRVMEHLARNGSLLTVKSIELQSRELKEFEAAVETLSKHNIVIPRVALDDRRRVLIDRHLTQAAPKEFAARTWVLIDGKVTTAANPQSKTLTLRFDYVPTVPSRVAFTCSVPFSEVRSSELLQPGSTQSMELRIFGRIVSSTTTGAQTTYSLSCYAAFR